MEVRLSGSHRFVVHSGRSLVAEYDAVVPAIAGRTSTAARGSALLATIRQRNFALLWTAGLVSLVGDWLLFTVLQFYVYDRTGSTVASAVMLVMSIAPGVLFGS